MMRCRLETCRDHRQTRRSRRVLRASAATVHAQSFPGYKPDLSERSPKTARCEPVERNRKFVDSPLEEDGFEPAVPFKGYPVSFALGAGGSAVGHRSPFLPSGYGGPSTGARGGRRAPIRGCPMGPIRMARGAPKISKIGWGNAPKTLAKRVLEGLLNE